MMNARQKKILVLLLFVLLTQSGCALLKLPFDIIGEVFKIIQKVPTPPPGVF